MVPMAFIGSGACHRSASMCQQRDSTSAVFGYFIPQSQEYLIRCEIQQFLKELEQVQTGYQIRFNKDEVLVLDDLKQEIAYK